MENSAAQQIIVEAARIDSERIDPSRSVTIIAEKEISNRKVLTVADLLRDVPGIQVVRQGALGQTASVFIRGARSEGSLILIDGIEMNDASSTSRGFDFSTLSVTNIERIEVYRGPQSVRFGAGAIGGVINIITKEGKEQGSTLYLAETGSYETAKGSIQTSGANKAIGYSVGLDGYTSNGISAAVGGAERDSAKIYSALGKVSWHLAPKTDVTASVRHSAADIEIDRNGGAASDDPNYRSGLKQISAGMTVRSRFIGDRFKTSLGTYISEYSRKLKNEPDILNTEDLRNNFFGRNYKTQFDSDYLLGEYHTLRFGFQYREEQARSDTESSGVFTSVAQKGQQVFGESITYLFDNEKWFYDMGIRYDQSSSISSIQSHRASLGRNFLNFGTKLIFTYGNGFKLPSLYQLYSSFGDSSLKYEKAKSIDFTVEQVLNKRNLLIMTYFESRYSDMIDFNTSIKRYFNIAKAKSKGLETTFRSQFNTDCELDIFYSYIDAKDEDTRLGLLRRPYHSAGFRLNHQWKSFEAYMRYQYYGSRPDIDPVSFERIQNSAYDLWEVGGLYKYSKIINLNARIENLFDRKYEEVAGYGGPGLAFYLGLAGSL